MLETFKISQRTTSSFYELLNVHNFPFLVHNLSTLYQFFPLFLYLLYTSLTYFIASVIPDLSKSLRFIRFAALDIRRPR